MITPDESPFTIFQTSRFPLAPGPLTVSVLLHVTLVGAAASGLLAPRAPAEPAAPPRLVAELFETSPAGAEVDPLVEEIPADESVPPRESVPLDDSADIHELAEVWPLEPTGVAPPDIPELTWDPAAHERPLPTRKSPEPPAEVPPPPRVTAATAPPPREAPGVVRIGACPRPDRCEKPRYPRRAQRRGWQGRVVLLVDVDRTGTPTRVVVDVSSGRDLLDEAAADAVRDWTFRPATEDGRPVPDRIRVPVTFRL